MTTVRNVMEKSGFKLLSDEEYAVSVRGKYLVDFPIAVDSSKVTPMAALRLRIKVADADSAFPPPCSST